MTRVSQQGHRIRDQTARDLRNAECRSKSESYLETFYRGMRGMIMAAGTMIVTVMMGIFVIFHLC